MKQQQRDNKRSFMPPTARTPAKAKLPVNFGNCRGQATAEVLSRTGMPATTGMLATAGMLAIAKTPAIEEMSALQKM